MLALSVSDTETRSTIKSIYDRHKILLEPHGSVGWTGLQKYYAAHPIENSAEQLSVTLETAHPAKFPQEIQAILGFDPTLPKSLMNLDHLKEEMHPLKGDYESFKKFLLEWK